MSRLFISAAHKSSGKTTVALGLCAAWRERGLDVVPFKKGPDYIDPIWLGRASQHECRNLDFYTMEEQEILALAGNSESQDSLSLIEGNKGLYDGLDLDGHNSNAALAKLLQTPVILVIDARGMTRGVAPLILGYQAFDANVDIGGVILNKLGGSRHESKLKNVIEHYTNVPVLGAIHQDKRLEITERHLGLIPGNEDASASDTIATIAKIVAEQVDLSRLLEIAESAPGLPATPLTARVEKDQSSTVKIGIAQDTAFGFYYPDDLQALEAAGAELVRINTLSDTTLPPLDGLFIGGGFPETQMEALEANTSLRREIRETVINGLPTYVECGGLMYLCRSIQWKNQRREMVGVIPGDIHMDDRPQGRGYVRLSETAAHPWPRNATMPTEIAAHEFHYSRIENLEPAPGFAYEVRRGTGVNGSADGIVLHNLLASYSHLRNTRKNPWASRFIAFVRQYKLKLTTIPNGKTN